MKNIYSLNQDDMALKKMQNPRLNLKSEKYFRKVNGGKNKNRYDAAQIDHKKNFLDRIERIEKRGQGLAEKSSSNPLSHKAAGGRNKDMEDKEKGKITKPRDNAELVTDLSGRANKEADVSAEKIKNSKELPNKKNEPKKKIVKKEYKTLKFPKGFLWGTATSAYQTEGGIKNNWSVWEKSGRRRKELMEANKDLKDYQCRSACDSYNRYPEDLELAKRLNNNAVRFGIEWARVQPKKDTWDVEAINHYRGVLKEAKKNGLTTVVTLWHWTVPVWFARENGWENDNSLEPFIEYVKVVIKELGADIDYWVTLNEPMAPIGFGYMRGSHPPGKRWAIRSAGKVFKNLVLAHKKTYKLIHGHFPHARVSIASLTDYFEPRHRWNPLDKLVVKAASYWHHRKFLEEIKNYLDYIGCNYYFHNRVTWLPPYKINKNERVNDMGWELYPEGIYHVLKYLNKFNVPILITENGIADANDDQRPNFIRNHLKYIHKAIADGVDVRGYFHWSLMDNFEWAWGWGPKFGLYKMDRETFKRTPRPSAKLYKEICGSNSVKVEK